MTSGIKCCKKAALVRPLLHLQEKSLTSMQHNVSKPQNRCTDVNTLRMHDPDCLMHMLAPPADAMQTACGNAVKVELLQFVFGRCPAMHGILSRFSKNNYFTTYNITAPFCFTSPHV